LRFRLFNPSYETIEVEAPMAFQGVHTVEYNGKIYYRTVTYSDEVHFTITDRPPSENHWRIVQQHKSGIVD
jgi:hypothetical protein